MQKKTLRSFPNLLTFVTRKEVYTRPISQQLLRGIIKPE